MISRYGEGARMECLARSETEVFQKKLADEQLFKSYFFLVQAWVRTLLSRHRMSLVDEEQIALEVINDFMIRLRSWKEENAADEAQRMRLCRSITRCHVINSVNRFKRKKRLLEQTVVSLTPLVDLPCSSDPRIEVECSDLLSYVLATLNVKQQAIVRYRYSHWSNREIAMELGISVRAVELSLKKIETHIERLLHKDEADQSKSQR